MHSHPPYHVTRLKERRVLVIGGTCVDVIVSQPRNARGSGDRIRSVRFAVGGTAFNVASNVAARGFDVLLLTGVSTGTLSYAVISQHLRRMELRHIIRGIFGSPRENVHVAQLNHQHVVSAVTSSGIERALFPKELLEREIRAAALVICDCNLRVSHIREISRLCRRYRRPALAAAVSAAKVPRLSAAVEYLTHRAFEAVVMNSHEARAVANSSSRITPVVARRICKRVSARHVLITRGVAGFNLLSSEGAVTRFRAPEVPRVVSELGAGDSVLAALAAFIVTHGHIDWKKWHSSYLAAWLATALADVAATAGGSLPIHRSGKLRKP